MPNRENYDPNEYIDSSYRLEIESNNETAPINPITTAANVQVKIGYDENSSNVIQLNSIINNDILTQYSESEFGDHDSAIVGSFSHKITEQNRYDSYYSTNNGEDRLYPPQTLLKVTEEILIDTNRTITDLSSTIDNMVKSAGNSHHSGNDYFDAVYINYKPVNQNNELYDPMYGYEGMTPSTNNDLTIRFYTDIRWHDKLASEDSDSRIVKVTLYAHPFGIRYVYDMNDENNKIETATDSNKGFKKYIGMKLIHQDRINNDNPITFPAKTSDGFNVMLIRSEYLYKEYDPIGYRPDFDLNEYMFNGYYCPIIVELKDGSIIHCNTWDNSITPHRLFPGIGNAGFLDGKEYDKAMLFPIVAPLFLLCFEYIDGDTHRATTPLRRWYDSILNKSTPDNYGMSLDNYTEFFRIINGIYSVYDDYSYTQSKYVVLKTGLGNRKVNKLKPILYIPEFISFDYIDMECLGAKVRLKYDHKNDGRLIQTPIGEFKEYIVTTDPIYIQNTVRFSSLKIAISLPEECCQCFQTHHMSRFNKLTSSELPEDTNVTMDNENNHRD